MTLTPEQRREIGERLAKGREERRAKLRNPEGSPVAAEMLDTEEPQPPAEAEQGVPAADDAGAQPEPVEDDLNPFAESSVPDETLGRMAEALAGNEVAAEAHRAAYREIMLAWANTALDARDLREELYHDYRAQMRFRDKLVALSRGSKVRDRNKAAMKVVR